MSTTDQVEVKQINVPLEQITEEHQDILLRGSKLNAKGSQGQYAQELKQNIKARHFKYGTGLIERITLAPVWNQATGEPVANTYFLVNGKQRLSIYKALNEEFPGEGFDTIPAQINYSIKTLRPDISNTVQD